jgi:hypothetical protein
MVMKDQRIKKKDTYKKEERGNKKQWESNYQEAQHTSSWTRGLTS